MSSFKTPIPIDIDVVKALLPPDSYVEAITLDPETVAAIYRGDVQSIKKLSVVVQWGNPRLITPFSVPHEWTLEHLQGKTTPDQVKVQKWPPEPPKQSNGSKPAVQAPVKPRVCNRCGIVAPPTHFDNNLAFHSEKCYREHLDAKLAKAGVEPKATAKRKPTRSITPKAVDNEVEAVR